MTRLKLTAIGEGLGLVLPHDFLERLHVGQGDALLAVETPNGIELTRDDPELARQLEAAARVMREDREALEKLAK